LARELPNCVERLRWRSERLLGRFAATLSPLLRGSDFERFEPYLEPAKP
jgi:hypothetical protein